MDFNNFCPVERTDEIGVLANSLNSLSSNLSAALMELKEANQKLQADIDKEKELELRRMEFFSAASHELKTPITIIKGQLQGMLCGIGRYKDRETYLAQSLEVTNSLEKMVQELLTVSRIEAPQYSCVKTHFDFTQFLRQRLAAFDDRDNALQKFKTEFQNYVDNLSEADLTSSNIKTVLSEKADELENSLSTAKMKLSCEVESVEVHNAGEEIVNN